MQFIPEVIVVGTDPATGLLTRGFTIYYGIGDITTGSGGSVGVRNYEGPLGVVSVEDPIETLPVSCYNLSLFHLYTLHSILYLHIYMFVELLYMNSCFF